MRTQPGWSLDTSLWGGIWHVVVSCQVCVLLHKHGPKISFREISASLVYFFILAALCSMQDLSSPTRLNPRTLHWKPGVLTAGQPRKSPSMFIGNWDGRFAPDLNENPLKGLTRQSSQGCYRAKEKKVNEQAIYSSCSWPPGHSFLMPAFHGPF